MVKKVTHRSRNQEQKSESSNQGELQGKIKRSRTKFGNQMFDRRAGESTVHTVVTTPCRSN